MTYIAVTACCRTDCSSGVVLGPICMLICAKIYNLASSDANMIASRSVRWNTALQLRNVPHPFMSRIWVTR